MSRRETHEIRSCLSGGGAKGIVFVGAYLGLGRRGRTTGRLLGTSAGAITATLISARYAPEEMLVALNER